MRVWLVERRLWSMVVRMLRTARKLLFFRRMLCGEHMVDRTIGYENREGRAHERRVAGRKRRWSEGERVWSRLRSMVDWCS